MNYRVVSNILGKVLLAEALLLLLPMIAALRYHESALPFLWTVLPLLMTAVKTMLTMQNLANFRIILSENFKLMMSG